MVSLRLFLGMFLGMSGLTLVFGNSTISAVNNGELYRRDLIDNTTLIFVEPLNEKVKRTRNQAVEYCHALGGELVKIKDYKLLRRILISKDLSLSRGTYWVDGKLKGDGKVAVINFAFNKTCTADDWTNQYSRLPVEKKNVDLCLALVKASHTKRSGIMVKKCKEKHYTICSIPDAGCTETTTTVPQTGK